MTDSAVTTCQIWHVPRVPRVPRVPLLLNPHITDPAIIDAHNMHNLYITDLAITSCRAWCVLTGFTLDTFDTFDTYYTSYILRNMHSTDSATPKHRKHRKHRKHPKQPAEIAESAQYQFRNEIHRWYIIPPVVSIAKYVLDAFSSKNTWRELTSGVQKELCLDLICISFGWKRVSCLALFSSNVLWSRQTGIALCCFR